MGDVINVFNWHGCYGDWHGVTMVTVGVGAWIVGMGTRIGVETMATGGLFGVQHVNMFKHVISNVQQITHKLY